jgi:NAD-dependent dihydropyrimidine dehydrogenase PreA subunit
MKREAIAQYLKRSVLFSEATTGELERFAEVARVQIVSAGQYIYHQGDPSEVFYVIALGEVELLLERDGGAARLVARVGPGGHFGETGIITGKPHSLSVRALCDLVLICFDKRYFRIAFLANTRIHQRLDMALAERLRVAFLDQVDNSGPDRPGGIAGDPGGGFFFENKNPSAIQLRRMARRNKDDLRESKAGRRTRQIIEKFAANCEPFLLTGETGTGKAMIARQIHQQSSRSGGQFIEVDLREYEPVRLIRLLFGTEQSTFPFAQARQAGFFEQSSGGSLIFSNAHLLARDLQERLVRVIKSSVYSHVDGERPIAMMARIGFISPFPLEHLASTEKLIPELLELLSGQHYDVPPLRQLKEDLPRLVSHYLEQFSREYGKNIHSVSPETLGILMNYDWPGNLTELSAVIRRAVMLAKANAIDPDQILLDLPKTEGKWEYNILRVEWIRRFLRSKLYPAVPVVIIGCILLLTIIMLFFGPADPEANLGLTVGWYIGWPLMFFSFFFLARTWCSVCSLAVPGTLLQKIVHPTRKTPAFIKNYSGWIMAILCILVFWIEIVWNAYDDPHLTGAIILVITFGSILFSVLYSRRIWCRYLCPLGAVNAIFAMPSVIELRANRHVCLNRCQSHSCYRGDAEVPGCPMFRHPYLVDNNRDCIMCTKCIKTCDNSSIQLNLRLAPQELWAMESPRRPDSFLIVAMGAIFFPFALHDPFFQLTAAVGGWLTETIGLSFPVELIASVLFFALIFVFQLGYYLMVDVQSRYAGLDQKLLLPLFGYGCIPLILGGYMALHLEFFVSGAGRIVPNIQEMFGMAHSYENIRLISADSTYVLQVLTVFGGLLASLYASYRIIGRVMADEAVTSRALIIPYAFLLVLGGLFVFIV